MQIVIDIPEEVYRAYKMDVTLGCLNEDQRGYAKWYLIHGLVNGIPLPKGHGRLIDTDELLDTFWTYCKQGDFGYHQAEDLIKSALTIIEADNQKGANE